MREPDSSPEASEADLVEQDMPVAGHERDLERDVEPDDRPSDDFPGDPWPAGALDLGEADLGEADPADVVDQLRTVPYDEEDLR